MTNNDSTATNAWLHSHNIVDSLNQVLDPILVLSDIDLQNELAVFANAQFKYDTAPGSAIEDHGKIDDIKQNNNNYAMNTNNTKYRRESKQSPNMHSLLNVKLASLAENNYHTSMSHDAISRFYDESPDCSPPNGYYSPNPSPPNGISSANPTPPNGYLPSTTTIFHDIVNPPITFYGDDAIMGFEDEEFMKTMRILTSTSPYENELIQQKPEKAHLHNKKHETVSKVDTYKKAEAEVITPDVKSEVNDDDDDDDEDMDEETFQNDSKNNRKQKASPVLSKEDKRRRNTAASARFRVKKKLREQVLQHTANEMTEKANILESRVRELEQEVKWLKDLIVEKKDSRLEEMLRHHDDAQYSPVAGLNTEMYFSLQSQQI